MGMCSESSPPLPENQLPQKGPWLSAQQAHLHAGGITIWVLTFYLCLPSLPPCLHPPSFSPSLPEMSGALQTPDTPSCISFLLLCNKLPQAQWLKPTQIDYLTILGFLPRAEVKVSAGAVVPHEAWGFLPRSLVVDRI